MRKANWNLVVDLGLVAFSWICMWFVRFYDATATVLFADREAGYHALDLTQWKIGLILQVLVTLAVAIRIAYTKLSLLSKLIAVFVIGYWLSDLSGVFIGVHRAMHHISGAIISGPK
jgi:hypothetical protein